MAIPETVTLAIDATVGEGFDRLAVLATPETREAYIDGLIVSGVDTATRAYRMGRPGRGAYELARLAMRLNRLLDAIPEVPQ
jgi:hypothetical protein